MNESIGIQPIHIRFSTNANGDSNQILTQNMIFVPPKEDDDDNEQNSDTTSEKENTSKKESYPFFTDQVRLSVSKLLNVGSLIMSLIKVILVTEYCFPIFK